MYLIVIRHGETELNRDERLQGSKGPDLPLDARGREMVKTLRDDLLITPTRMYVSPLLRTRETAEILNQRFNVPIIIVPELVERDFGSLSGKYKKDIDPLLIQNDLDGKYDYRPFGGESVDDVKVRVLGFLSTLPLSTDETVFLIAHRGIVRVMYDLFPRKILSKEVLPASKHAFDITELPV